MSGVIILAALIAYFAGMFLAISGMAVPAATVALAIALMVAGVFAVEMIRKRSHVPE